jgi:hypothetical protein
MPELGLVQAAWRNPIWGIGVQNLKAAEHRTIRHLSNVSGGLRPGAWLASRGSIPLKRLAAGLDFAAEKERHKHDKALRRATKIYCSV